MFVFILTTMTKMVHVFFSNWHFTQPSSWYFHECCTFMSNVEHLTKEEKLLKTWLDFLYFHKIDTLFIILNLIFHK